MFRRPFTSAVPGADRRHRVGRERRRHGAILYQKPVLVAVHGRNMLKQLELVP